MADCRNHRGGHPNLLAAAERMTDDRMEKMLRTHSDPDFWQRIRKEPNQYAYARRWSSIVRREARRRGLLGT